MSSTVQINNDGYIGGKKKKTVLYRLKTPDSKHKNQSIDIDHRP
jgi:hypothetical protein